MLQGKNEIDLDLDQVQEEVEDPEVAEVDADAEDLEVDEEAPNASEAVFSLRSSEVCCSIHIR